MSASNETNPGVGTSFLKSSPFAAGLLNMIFTSTLFKGIIGWGKRNAPVKMANNLNASFASMKPVLLKALRGRHRFTNSDNDEDPEVAEARIKELAMKNIASELYRIVGETDSPFVSALQTCTDPMNSRQVCSQFTEIEGWFPPANRIPNPTQGYPQYMFRLKDLIMICAINDVSSAREIKRQQKEAEEKGLAYKEPSAEKWRAVIESLEKAKGGVKKTDKTAQGEVSPDVYDECIRYVEEMKDTIPYDNFLKYYESIPAGSHLAYQFSGGAIHHAIYLGNFVIIEVVNLDEGDIKGHITVTHLYDFVVRARNSPSELICFVYNDPYPTEVIQNRAVWSIGRYPGYHISKQSCESFAYWVMTNNYEAQMCVILKDTRLKPFGDMSRMLYIEPAPPVTAVEIRANAANAKQAEAAVSELSIASNHFSAEAAAETSAAALPAPLAGGRYRKTRRRRHSTRRRASRRARRRF